MDDYLPFFLSSIVDDTNTRVQILDVGGAERFWYAADPKYMELSDITMVNLEQDQSFQNTNNHFFSVIGDATHLDGYGDKSVDLAFSNSVIEHVGCWEDKVKMVKEMKRVGKHIYLQTPNKFFPIEPHFLIPFFYLFSNEQQVRILARKEKCTIDKARALNDSISLLSYKDLKKLFPDQKIHRERFLGFTKSFIVFY